MLIYKYYKFPSKELVPKFWPENVSVSEIGLIKKDLYIYDNQGNVIGEQPEDPSWYVNICYSGAADLSNIEQYEIRVKTPNRVWFGQQT